MPWTRRQVRYLESSGSPLTADQKAKMNSELHANPKMGHAKKGSAELKKRAEMNAGVAKFKGESHSYSHMRPVRKVVSRYSK